MRVLLVRVLLPSGAGEEGYPALGPGVLKVLVSPCPSYSPLHFKFFEQFVLHKGSHMYRELLEEN